MAKASIPGRAKTRLTPPFTAEQAAELNSAFLLDIAENLALAADRAPIAPFMAFGPPGTAPFFERHLPPDIGLIEMWHPDFGQCLFRTIEALLNEGYGAACVLNSDSPTLPTHCLVKMAQTIMSPGDRAVLGPSTDGGYYLLALKVAHDRLFQDVAWSTDIVAHQTLERAREIELPVTTLQSWYDVDDAQSLNRLKREIAMGRSAEVDFHWPRHAATTLERLFSEPSALAFEGPGRRDAGGAP